MMTSLFSSFDPLNSTLSLNYLSLTLPLLFMSLNTTYLMSNRKMSSVSQINQFITSELEAILNNSNKKGKTLIFLSIFMLLLLLNSSGLLPYVFTMTAHMAFTLSLALPLWMSFIMFSMFKNPNHFLSHMVPLSTPIFLSQFMTIIETISQIIRPITLSVRLAANMTAGHILMALASAPILMLNQYSIVLLLLLILESAVAIIQSYVFMILLSMYLAETY